jgi:hypothetical protein
VLLEAVLCYKTQVPAGHEEGPQTSGGKSSGRYRAAAKTAAANVAGSGRRLRRPLLHTKRAATKEAAVTGRGRRPTVGLLHSAVRFGAREGGARPVLCRAVGSRAKVRLFMGGGYWGLNRTNLAGSKAMCHNV